MRLFIAIIAALYCSVAIPAQTKRDALRAYNLGNFPEAVEICVEELRNFATADSYVVLGWSLVKLQEYERAEAHMLEARKQYRYDPRLIEIYGEILYYKGENDKALKVFQEYASLAPEGSRIDLVYYFMGEILIRLGRYRHADIALSTAIRFVPGNALWWTRLGYAREKAGEASHAADAYDRAIALDPLAQDAIRGLERVRRMLMPR